MKIGSSPSPGQVASVMIRADVALLKNPGSSPDNPLASTAEPALAVTLVNELIENHVRPVKEELRKLANGGAAKLVRRGEFACRP